jgi:hypothetical protein
MRAAFTKRLGEKGSVSLDARPVRETLARRFAISGARRSPYRRPQPVAQRQASAPGPPSEAQSMVARKAIRMRAYQSNKVFKAS